MPETSRKQDLRDYAEEIFPKKLLDEYDAHEKTAESRISRAGVLQKVDTGSAVDPHYASKMTRLQLLEHQQRKKDLTSAALYAVQLSIYKPSKRERRKASMGTYLRP